jgi:hypothetical protein
VLGPPWTSPQDRRDSPSRGGDPNELRDQGWAVIVPQGKAGDRLLALTAPLLDKRATDQESDEVDVYRVPPDMTAAQAVQWVDGKLIGNRPITQIPGYVCVLGDPEQVSLELQQILTASFYTGRIAFDEEAQYEAYVHKLLRWEHTPPNMQGRALFFTARDGTPATELGHRVLMQPIIADVREQGEKGRYELAEILAFDSESSLAAVDGLLAAARTERPGVLMTCSHGAGAPRRGWESYDRQRALQGAICLSRGESITARDLAETPFMPGGLWFFFACFGVATPTHSAYYHWLHRLREIGEFGGDLESVLRSLPGNSAPSFLAALPKAVLANPDGPLAVIGHIDLAWSHGFQDIEKSSGSERHRRFAGLLDAMLRGYRVGLALADLQRARNLVKTDLTTAADGAVRAEVAGQVLPDERLRLGHRWMLHHDLEGYALLGDPAARLAITQPLRHARHANTRTFVTTAALPPAATSGRSSHLTLLDMEAAVHAMIAGQVPTSALAVKYDVSMSALKEWEDIYTDAGREALLTLLAASRAS